jgi:hypothetical protein
MPFTNYTELQAEIVLWLGDRTDLVTRVPTFITLTEDALSRDLRSREQHERIIAILNEQFEWLPEDFGKLDYIMVKDGEQGRRQRLKYKTMAQLDAMDIEEQASALPSCFSTIGNQIRFWPEPTPLVTPPGNPDPLMEPQKFRHFEIGYWRRIDNLTDSVPVNEILVRYPMLYLYGALVQAEPYIANLEQSMFWKQQYNEALAGANIGDSVDTRSTPSISLPEDAP